MVEQIGSGICQDITQRITLVFPGIVLLAGASSAILKVAFFD